MVRTSLIRLPDKVYDEVEELGLEKGLAVATQIRVILIDHLKQLKK